MFELILVALASAAVKRLVSGASLDRSVVADAAAALTRALLSSEDLRDVRLGSIEAHLEHMALQPFENPMRSGISLLERAERQHRQLDDRLHDLSEARLRFLDAAAGAPDPQRRAIAHYHVAICSLSRGDITDSHVELADAASEALHALLQAANRARWPGAIIRDAANARPKSVSDRLADIVGWPETASAKDIEQTVRQQLREQTDYAASMVAGVLRTRKALGVSYFTAVEPTVVWDDWGNCEVVIEAEERTEFDALFVEAISWYGPPASRDQSHGYVELRVTCGIPMEIDISGFRLYRAQTAADRAVAQRLWHDVPEPALPLVLKGHDEGRRLEGGEVLQGWLRIPWSDRPTVTLTRYYPAAGSTQPHNWRYPPEVLIRLRSGRSGSNRPPFGNLWTSRSTISARSESPAGSPTPDGRSERR